jgi:hypothetical protein
MVTFIACVIVAALAGALGYQIGVRQTATLDRYQKSAEASGYRIAILKDDAILVDPLGERH